MLSPNTLARSSLEEMLNSLRQRDEPERPKDAPPALPIRPPSRARIRSGRWGTQASFELDVDGEIDGVKEEDKRKENDSRVKRNTIWSNIRRTDVNVDSPYYLKTEEGMKGEEERRVLEGIDNIGYFIKKVSMK